MKSILKSYINKAKFKIGLTPKLTQSNFHSKDFIPEPFKSVCLISADLELAWAFRYSKRLNRNIFEAEKLGIQTRENIPKILNLSEAFNIPITWATVGHLFLDSCKKENNLIHPEIIRLGNFENKFWEFKGTDWFEDDPCSNFQDAPAWYCPDLIQKIIESTVKHEIACHTFSHIDCRDVICTDEVFLSEIKYCKNIASRFGIELKSFVHPGHQIGNLNNLRMEGFTSFRSDYGDVLGYPKYHSNGLWEFQNSAELRLRNGWSTSYITQRYIEILKRSIRFERVCVFWFHPSFDPIILDKVLPVVFKFINDNRNKIWVTTHHEYVKWLERRKMAH